MPAKKSNQSATKSRTSSGARKKQGFVFKWWMGVIIAVILVGFGIVYISSSNAATVTNSYNQTVTGWQYGTVTGSSWGDCSSLFIDTNQSGRWKQSCQRVYPGTQIFKWFRNNPNGSTTCALIASANASLGQKLQDKFGGLQVWNGKVITISETNSCQ